MQDIKEYWVNVYDGNILGRKHNKVFKAIVYAYSEGPLEPYEGWKCGFTKPPLYRIHVKMKPLKQTHVKAIYHGIHKNWMDV